MNKKEAEKLINEVQRIGASRGWDMLDKLLDLIDRVEKIEREACALICDELHDQWEREGCNPSEAADAIRARARSES